jgi:hypothetical protein
MEACSTRFVLPVGMMAELRRAAIAIGFQLLWRGPAL